MGYRDRQKWEGAKQVKYGIYKAVTKMEKYRYTKEWEDKCRQNIWWKKSCADCLFETLCLFQKNQEKVLIIKK